MKETRNSRMEELEGYFIETFVKKEKRERLRHELSHPNKRYAGLDRFCHQAEAFLDQRKIHLQGNDLERQMEFVSFVGKHKGQCLILAADVYPDGQTMELEEALSFATKWTEAVIIIHHGFAIVFGEAMKGGRDKYLLLES